MVKRHRVVLAKMGLDCHDTGIVIVAQLLRDHGYEVIYLGLHNSADSVVRAALQENADAIGISFLSGQHMTQVRLLLQALRQQDIDIPVLCGGVIPREDAAELSQLGVTDIFFPGTLGAEVVRRFDQAVQRDGRAA